MLRLLRRPLAGLVALAAFAPLAAAQDPPLHARFLGRFDQPSGSYADVWGDGQFAYLAHFGQPQVDIIDVSNPSNPTLAATYFVTAPDQFASAQDVKVAGGLMFIGLESSSANGVEIVDVRDPFNPTFLTKVDPEPGNFEPIHNTFYDNGWLYMVNSSDNTIAIVDLRNYDPDNPPAAIGSWTYMLSGVGTAFVHDLAVANGRLYAAAWDSLEVYDVSNLGAGPPVKIGSVRGMNCHAVWPTADGKYVITIEERQGGATRLYEVVELGGGNIRLDQRDSYVADPSASFSGHNPVVFGDRVYVAHYQAGVVVLQIDRSAKTFERVASFDTSTVGVGGFDGCWGVYPYLGTDRVLASDLENGLYTIDFSAIQIAWPAPRPQTVQPLGSQPITVELTALGGAVLDPAAVTLHARVDGGAETTAPMTAVGAGQYQASLPMAPCNARIDYWVTAADTAGEVYSDPADGGAAPHTTYATSGLVTEFFDDFTTDQGWTVSNQNLSTGAWERGTPIPSGACPDSDDPDGSGTRAYVTDQGPVGGGVGDADVDGGPTTLTSPTFSLSGDGLISYSRWFFNSTLDGDALDVEINRGDGWRNVETVVDRAGAWERHTFRVSDVITGFAGGSLAMRFRTSDNPNNAITEAGLDGFLVQSFQCSPLAGSVTRNGSGVNPVGYVETSPAALGTTWDTTVDIATPGAVASFVALSGAGPLQLPTALGELLIDLSQPLVAPIAFGVGSHSIPVPPDVGLLGLTLYTQAATFSPGVIQLQNAIDITFGY